MHRLLYIFIVLFLSGCVGPNSEVKFIPQSRLTQSEVELERQKFDRNPDWEGFTFEEIFGDGAGIYKYRETDIRQAFDRLDENDEMLSLCGNSVMGKNTLIAFTSVAESTNKKWLKTSSCSPVEGGLKCQPIKLDMKYFYNGVLFDMGVGGNFDKAVQIIDTFKKFCITDLPDFEKRFEYKMINRIEKTNNGYLIRFGEVYCSGCVSSVIVKPVYKHSDSIESLEYLDAFGNFCI